MKGNCSFEVHQAGVRSGLYRLLGLTLLTPPDPNIVALWKDSEMQEELRTFFSGACLDELKLGIEGPESSPRAIKLAYDALFSVPIKGKCVTPYESVYREEHVIDEKPIKLLMGRSAQDVQRFYSSAGLEPPDSARELPDHIGMELLFMAGMCGQQSEAIEAGQEEEARNWNAMQCQFLRQHLGEWVAPLANDIRKRCPSHFFRALATMMHELICDDMKMLAFVHAGEAEPMDGARV